MKAKRIIILLAAILPIFLACEKIIDIDIPDSERRIVLNGIINPESTISVNISRSLSVLEDNKFVFLDEATVKLFEDGSEKGLLKSIGNGYYELPGFLPTIGSSYRLEVESHDLQSVSAVSVVPERPQFSEVDTMTIYNEWGGSSIKLSFKINDPIQENYYAVSLMATYKYFDYFNNKPTDSLITSPQYFEFLQNGQGGIQDRLIEENASYRLNSNIFISDQLFNGKDFKMDLSMSRFFSPTTDTIWLDISVQHVTKSYFLYAASMNKYNRSNGNPFSEPVSVYTNIENGFGIFSSYSAFTRRVEIILSGRK